MGEIRFKLPDVGEGVVEAEIVEWRVKAGDTVKEDQPLVDVMTDKATVELPSPVDGVISKIVGEPGDVLPVGTEIVFITTEGEAPAQAELEPVVETAAAAAPEPKSEPAPAPQPPPAPAKPASSANGGSRPASAPAARSGEALASPAVRQRARDAGVDLGAVPGTGPAGRITHQDLDDFIAAGGRLMARGSAGGSSSKAPRDGVSETKLIGLRRKIAENMAQSKRTIPHFAYVEEVDVTALEELRRHLNKTKSETQPKLTFLPFLAQALVKALPDFPQANAHFDPEAGKLTQYEAVHVGVATATPNGLMVPVVRHAEALDLWQTASEVQRVAQAAREGSASRDELSGSTITITSLGALGGIVSTPIINAPETAIIGVNKMQERPVFDEDGRIAPRLFMNLSSSFDHRIVDGYDAASLIQRLKTLLEQPATIFM